jgi:DNA-binding response OmpR family regulator
MTTNTRSAPARKRHILVIEDNGNIRTQLATYFTQRQYHVAETNDTDNALQSVWRPIMIVFCWE